MARSTDRHYERWLKIDANPVIKSTEWGITETTDTDGNRLIYGSSDPSNIWKKDSKYYVLTGNLLVLNKYGRKPDSPEHMKGDWRDLLESDDLTTWTYKGRFYERNPEWTEPSEDNMCPSFLPLPASPDGGAPSGKRTLWLGEDGTLCMRPVPELELLRSDRQTWNDVALADGQSRKLENVVGDACELEITLAHPNAGRCGVKVRSSPGGEEQTLLYYDAEAKELVFDATRSGIDGRRVVERAPLELKDGEPLQLRVFVDRSVIEVYANDRQAICRRVYPGRDDSLDAVLFADGADAVFNSVKTWEMMPSNP